MLSLISHVLLVAMPIPLAAQSYEINPFGWMSYAMARPSLRERIRIIICKCERILYFILSNYSLQDKTFEPYHKQNRYHAGTAFIILSRG